MPNFLIHCHVWRAALTVLLALGLTATTVLAHVTLRASGPLTPGRHATILLVVPTERHVPTTQVSVEVPAVFLQAGGRLSRVQYPAGWQVEIIKEDKPDNVYESEREARARREGTEHAAPADSVPENSTPAELSSAPSEEEILNEMRRKWIKRVVFSGGSIPVDGFEEFSLSFQLPEQPGEYRFAAEQTYADGKVVSWSELAEGAERPAPSLVVAVPAGPVWPWQLAGVGVLVLLAFWAGSRRRRARS